MRVSVLADDPLSGDGAAAVLRGRADVELLPAVRRPEADVLLLVTPRADEKTVDLMGASAADSRSARMRIVLVADAMPEQLLFRAIDYGLVSVLRRRDASPERVLGAVLGVGAGQAEMPGGVLHRLVEQVRSVQRDVLAPNGLTLGGLQDREVEVLRLLADGMDTVEIADRLNYSERTIKNVIHGMMTRLNLRNRSHAVAFGIRCGAL
nr:response regulator transcription factor [Pseudonocardia acidicola]